MKEVSQKKNEKEGERLVREGLPTSTGQWWWSPLVVRPIFERGEMCFESYILDVCYPKKLFGICRILV